MATYDSEKEMWKSNTGINDYHSTKEGAETRDRNFGAKMSGGGGGGGGMESALLGALWALFLVFGKVVGRVSGFLIGLVLKLGMVGKIVLTTLMVFSGYTVVYVLVSTFIPFEWIRQIISLIGCAGIGYWFWKWHYSTIKNIPLLDFSRLSGYTFSIFFYGTIILWIVLAIFTSLKENAAMGVGMVIALILSILYWLWKTNPYKSFAYDDDIQENAGYANPPAKAARFDAQSAEQAIADRCYLEGDSIWARWSGDANLYFAVIAKVLPKKVKVVYYDGVEENVNAEDIFYLDEAQNSGLKPHGNWENKGDFYPCTILELREETALVQYEDKVKENLPYEGLVFLQ
jgi:hypothetical protein